MNEIIAKSWIHIQEILFSREDLWNETLRRFRSPMAYRGLNRSDYILRTSLNRLGGDYEKLEAHLLRNFQKYAHRDVVGGERKWHWLSVAQHHGLPTRLLDWTYSPYVALHFATANLEHYDKPGAVWAVNFEEARRALPKNMRQALDETGANGFTVELLDALDISPFDLDTRSSKLFMLFFEPPSLDDRIVNQYALFSFLSSSAVTYDTWLAENKDLWWKLIIPPELKWEVRDKLDQANITERVLFPGLGGLSKWLKRHYSPGPGSA